MADDQIDAAGVIAGATGDETDALGKSGSVGPAPPSSAPGSRLPAMSASEFKADCYNMNHKQRGSAIIFNNKRFAVSTGMGERSGTDVDCQSLYMLFTEMGFNTQIFSDVTTQQMESAMVNVGKTNHSDADCFACAVLSHGEEGFVYGVNGPIQIEKLVGPIKGHRCPSLAGKPKIVFIQACRGTQLDEGVEVADALGVTESDAEEVEIRRIPTEADFLMAYSVVPGFYAWRNSTRGSWFIQALVEVLRENWKRMDLLSMMTRVNKKVAYDFESNASKEFMNRKKQIPCITSMLTRDLYFTPKK